MSDREWREGTLPFTTEPRYLVRPPPANGGRTLLLALHGQGLGAKSFRHILRHLPPSRSTLLIPEGPYPFEIRRPPELRVGHSWYTYTGDQPGFREALVAVEEHLLALIDALPASTGVPRPERVVILGFSQGGYLAGFMALRHRPLCAGLVLASARLKTEFLSRELDAELDSSPLPPTLALHAQNDSALPWERAREYLRPLQERGADVEVFLHDQGHRLPAAAVERVGDWLARKSLDD